MPKGANEIIQKLQTAGFDAYIVGGCVRDALLGKTPKDWDITTPATPPEISAIFADQKQIDIGSHHGTIAVKSFDEYYEITTFRVDGHYTDGRRPDDVSFTRSLTEDLRRRDFTINAMAYNNQSGLVDPFGGEADLCARLIKCVGDAKTRFAEDYLRIIRAYRFAAVLNFDLEEKTRIAAIEGRQNLEKIARERVQTEMAKLLTTSNMNAIKIFLNDIGSIIFPGLLGEYNFEILEQSSPALPQRMAAILHKSDLDETKNLLKYWCFDNATAAKTISIIKHHDRSLPCEKIAIKRFVSEVGAQTARDVFVFQNASDKIELLDEIISSKEPMDIKDLALTGQDVMQILDMPRGPKIGGHLAKLLEAVIQNPNLNNPKDLTNLLLKA